jgi:hypothetical protein
MEYTITFSDEGLKRQFGKIPSNTQMAEIISEALISSVIQRQLLELGAPAKRNGRLMATERAASMPQENKRPRTSRKTEYTH